jgi:hypothetical protein
MFLSALLAAVLLIDPTPERGSFHAEVAIESYGSRGVAVYVDSNSDNSVDQFFLLQMQDHGERSIGAATKLERDSVMEGGIGPAMPGSVHFADAHVEFEPGYVRIIAGDEAVELFVEGTQAPSWNPSGARVWRRAGYGLAHQTYETAIPMNRAKRNGSLTSEFCDASSDCDPADTDGGGGGSTGGGGTLCDSGGPGATSCSVSSSGSNCSANCGTGYYACCINGSAGVAAKCRCIRG